MFISRNFPLQLKFVVYKRGGENWKDESSKSYFLIWKSDLEVNEFNLVFRVSSI